MGIIDKKGRFFNKINLLDLTIISFIILAISLIAINTAFRNKLFKKISDIPELEYVVIDVILPEDLTWVKKHITVGDIVEGSSFRNLTATVLEIKEVEGFSQTKRVMVKIKSYAAKDRLGALSFGRHPLRIGERIPFYTSRYIFEGQVTDIEMTGEKIILKD